MNKTPKIIGLCGSAGAGKDTALTLLKLQLQKFIAATNPGLTDLWHEA